MVHKSHSIKAVPGFVLLLAACYPTGNPHHDGVSESELKLIRDNLFIDGDGELYFRTSNLKDKGVYTQSLGLADPVNGHVPPSLTSTIDTATWIRRSHNFYSDETNAYCHKKGPGGGELLLMNNLNGGSLEAIIINMDDSWRRAKDASPDSIQDGTHLGHYTDGIIMVGGGLAAKLTAS